MHSLFLTEYIKSNMFMQDLNNKIHDHEINFDLLWSDIGYPNSPILHITPENKPENTSLIEAWQDAISASKNPLIILNELNISFLKPFFNSIENKNITIINLHTWLGSYGKKLAPEITDLDTIPEWFSIFEPMDLENLRNILKQNWKKYIRILHREMPNDIFDVDELWIIDAKMLESLDSISLKTYGFAGNQWTILSSGSLFGTIIQTWEILQNLKKEISIFILQKLNSDRNDEIIENINNSKNLFIIVDHENSKNLQLKIENKLKNLNLDNIQINIISPKYGKLTTIFNEYQDEQSDFNPEKLSERIISRL